ncbi:hypothetical protein WOLCODRAFT_162901 [Wolfiporia cocos MD-104 SS10]|uniref:Uncharacterized protein n=1 Tax=Wolfiporia cocos (strain MD-104) TaxID=742152 RepID=A0A2H3JYJ2_WOLCO|nr:hypothetical protein WOLCODRAFT_162901 [Wolfiporia cocos MD-104 SS10]
MIFGLTETQSMPTRRARRRPRSLAPRRAAGDIFAADDSHRQDTQLAGAHGGGLPDRASAKHPLAVPNPATGPRSARARPARPLPSGCAAGRHHSRSSVGREALRAPPYAPRSSRTEHTAGPPRWKNRTRTACTLRTALGVAARPPARRRRPAARTLREEIRATAPPRARATCTVRDRRSVVFTVDATTDKPIGPLYTKLCARPQGYPLGGRAASSAVVLLLNSL